VVVLASTLANAAFVGAKTVNALSMPSADRVVTRSAAVKSSTRVLNCEAAPVAIDTTVRRAEGGSRTASTTCTTPFLACYKYDRQQCYWLIALMYVKLAHMSNWHTGTNHQVSFANRSCACPVEVPNLGRHVFDGELGVWREGVHGCCSGRQVGRSCLTRENVVLQNLRSGATEVSIINYHIIIVNKQKLTS
jgi:hypothetical protein